MAEGITAHRTSVLVLMLMLLMAVSASSIANAQDADDSEGPGITWELPENHMLYMKGTEQQPFLDRNWTTNTGEPLGKAEFTKLGSAAWKSSQPRSSSHFALKATSLSGCSPRSNRPTTAVG